MVPPAFKTSYAFFTWSAVSNVRVRNIIKEWSESKMTVLAKIEFLELPVVRMIGKMVINGGGENPVPGLWEKCFQENTFDARTKFIGSGLLSWMDG